MHSIRELTCRIWKLVLIGLMGMGILAPPALAVDHEKGIRLYREGNELYDHGRFAECVADFDQSLQQDSQLVEGYYNRALAREMVDRSKAIADWKQFIEATAGHQEWKWDRARAQARLQILETLPPPPAGLSVGHYVETAADYYGLIAGGAEGMQWRVFPLKVFLGTAPELRWGQAAREALDTWSQIVPLRPVADASEADIRVDWEKSLRRAGQPIEETDWLETQRRGDPLSERRVVIITLDLSQRWSKDDMRAMILHELGHALGLRGHSDGRMDLMYMQPRGGSVGSLWTPGVSFWKALPRQPSQRDVNTLIRLYNSAGPITRFN